ncbi:Phosphoribosylamine--glycine ligase [Trypanosoma theileri]|uniref:Phosphoribosylamine--glycine ligase n=1 Tax=Trypanosoma theileri TaxID=67003 RepID=A0A1X0NYA4_9TRYP|nr:Phosphoribosylamine--glycine ligase [Trypanosoma theileri]ORC89686.1 Phosphoribosylamine--glycine ligase [Trypanosoma theileri]
MDKEVNGFSGRIGYPAAKETHAQLSRLLDVRAGRKNVDGGRSPCLIAFEISTRQQRYMKAALNAIRPIGNTRLPYFQADYLLETSEFYPTLKWKEVAECINSGPAVEIYFYIYDSKRMTPNDYEEYYQRVIKDEYKDILGFFTTVDGLVPLVDYLHARHFGGMPPPTTFLTPQGRMSSIQRVGDGRSVDAETRGTATVTNPCKHRTRILYGNDVETSVKRRQDKYSMQLTLRDHGLAYIRGTSGYSSDELKQWRSKEGIPFPVIVKPVSGGGSEYVSLCRNDNDIDTAFLLCNDASTVQWTQASHMVLQEYIEGQEYVVNVVSYNGRHAVSDVWKSWKFPAELTMPRNITDLYGDSKSSHQTKTPISSSLECNTTALLYDRLEFVHNLAELHEESEERRVVSYVLQCIDALGMRQGSSHCEVRVDYRPGSKNKDKPVLIELNARVLGDTPRSTPFVGYDQIMLMVYLAYCAACIPEDHLLCGSGNGISRNGSSSGSNMKSNEVNKMNDTRSMLPWPPVPLLYRSLSSNTTCHVIFLRTKEESYFCTTGLNYLRKLPTFKYISRNAIFDGQNRLSYRYLLRKTTDLLTSPCACVMEGTEEGIRRDYAIIREMENKDISSWNVFLDNALVAKGLDVLCLTKSADRVSARNSPAATKNNNNSNNNNNKYSSDLLERGATRKAAVEMVKQIFSVEPVLYVPVSYVNKLELLGLFYLLDDNTNAALYS